MKCVLIPLARFLVLLGLACGPLPMHAQSDSPGGRVAFLSAEDRAHLMKVRQQVLTEQPDLKTEQESLEKERQFVKDKGSDATSDDREMLRNNFMAHNEKMQAAMLKADPSIAPVLDQIKTKMREKYQQGASANGGNAGGSSP